MSRSAMEGASESIVLRERNHDNYCVRISVLRPVVSWVTGIGSASDLVRIMLRLGSMTKLLGLTRPSLVPRWKPNETRRQSDGCTQTWALKSRLDTMGYGSTQF